jgi:error-prone DNA polymerase
MPYAELQCRSNFSFLGGGTDPEGLVDRGVELGLSALALTDRNGLYGVVRFHQAAKQRGLKAIIGADITLAGGGEITLLVRDAAGYANLSTLLTETLMRSPRKFPATDAAAIRRHAGGLLLLAGAESPPQQALERGAEMEALLWLTEMSTAFGGAHVFLSAQRHLRAGQEARFARLHQFARRHVLPGVATNDVRYATRADRLLYDVQACIREGTTLNDAGPLLEPNAERRLKSAPEMRKLFADAPEWVAQSQAIADLCMFSMDDLHYRLPGFPTGAETAQSMLRRLTEAGALRRYGDCPSPRVRAQLEHELAIIGKLDLAGYFLIVHDIVRFCEDRGILCQGRGSAANSAVCYCLGITAVDPIGLNLLFERFLSPDRSEAPDIDIDIAHNYREAVLQYVYMRYGREHAAMVCEVITYRRRSAIRDTGKALGFSLEQVNTLSKRIESLSATLEQAKEAPAKQPSANQFGSANAASTRSSNRTNDLGDLGVEIDSPQMRKLLWISERMAGYPRHLSIHVGGMVVSADPLSRIVPVEPAAMENRSVIQWDKDDAAALGLVKIDLLGLGILTLLQEGFDLIEKHHGRRYALHELDYTDPLVYDLLCRADAVGVFQVESRAQMNTLPRLRPRCFYDLAVQVALIRPGPIQGEMVHPYLRRREGSEPVDYPHPDLIPILERTLGIPLFQEQGMRLAITAAGFSAGEADQLRKAMGHKRSRERMQGLLEKLVGGMQKNGYSADVSERIVNQLTAFADYGFPESHAASFALLVFASAWMKTHYPDAFYTALLNAQPMGFYSPSTIINDATRRGITVLPIDIQASGYACSLEALPNFPDPAGNAVRMGLRYVRGVGSAHEEALERVIARRPFRDARHALESIQELPINLQRNLIQAGTLESLGINRREARWQLEKLGHGSAGPLAPAREEYSIGLPAMDTVAELQADYGMTGFSVRHQPMTVYRSYLRQRGVKRACDLVTLPPESILETAGVVICRQRPGTARGMLFITLEDETGLSNLVIFPQILDRFRAALLYQPIILVRGKLERAHQVTNLIVQHAEALRGVSAGEQLPLPSRDFR